MENEIVSLRMPKYKISNMVLFHIMFWIISIATNAYAFKISNQISWLDFYYAAFAHICLVTGIYINHFILIPFIFEPHHYKKYVIFIAIDASIMVFLYFFTFNSLVDIVLPDYYFVSQFNELETFIYCMAYLSFTTLLKLSESWFELQEKNKLMLITEKENMHHQLKALKSQINPHFLFNSLNVIYSQALKKSNELPEIIIKLSDILRYVIYKSKKNSIKTDEEVELINDYLILQRYSLINS